MGIKVVMSEKEASSKVFEVLPTGWYKVTISDVELKESKSEKNSGKPFYAIEFTINAPEKFEGRKVFGNVMLWAGAAYSLNQLLNALGIQTEGGAEVEVPEPEDLLGEEIMVKLGYKPAQTVKTPTGDKTYDEGNEVKGMAKITDTLMAKVNATGKAGGTSSPKTGASLLPS
jgi:hypothetical protein